MNKHLKEIVSSYDKAIDLGIKDNFNMTVEEFERATEPYFIQPSGAS